MSNLGFRKTGWLYLLLVSALLLGRLSGFLRDIYITKTLGIGRSSDFLLAVLQIPDFLAGLLLVAGLNAYLIPKLQSASEFERASIMGDTAGQTLLFFGCLALVLIPFSSFLGEAIVPGLMPLTIEESTNFKIILALIPVAAISGVFSVWLIFRGWVLFGGLGTLIINVTIISALIFCGKVDNAYLCVTFGLFLGLASRAWFLFSVAKRAGMPLLRAGPVLRFPSGHLLLVAASISAVNIFPMVIRSLGSTYGEGYLSILSIAVKAIELPLAVGLASFGLVSLSVLSELYSKNCNEAALTLRHNLHWAMLLGLGAGLVLLIGGRYAGPQLVLFSGYTSEQIFVVLEMVSVGGIFLPIMGRCLVMISDTSARQDYVVMLACLGSSVCACIIIALMFPGDSPIVLVMIWGGMFGLASLLLEIRRWFLRGAEGLYTLTSVSCMFVGLIALIFLSLSAGAIYHG